jgi:uncharacterized membrane protein YphA (DoxX/SURF4 family)
VTAQRSSSPRSAKRGRREPAGRRPASRPARGESRTRDHGAGPVAGQQAALASLAARSAAVTAAWAPTAGRILLGLVLGWFGYHELVRPALWTGYVPLVHAPSAVAILLVLAHGWLLLMLAVALVAGIMSRAAAAVAAVLLLEVVVSLTVTGGLSDLTLRDVGVLGLAIVLAGPTQQRLTLGR